MMYSSVETGLVLPLAQKMMPFWRDRWARNLIIRFLNDCITLGCLTFLEEDGTVLNFGDSTQKSSLKASVRIHNSQFYWKVATQADVGFTDAFIKGDISFVDPNEGLLQFFLIFISNDKNRKASMPSFASKRGWYSTPLILAAGLESAKNYIKYVFKKNTLPQARRNASQHYDLSNELFHLFMDETLMYSCAIFESEDEELKTAQLRKISSLIEKAKISKEHHVLELGCGWGSLAIETVKRTGCQYTGITLSEQQLIYAEQKVKEAGLQDRIKLLICDYRELPDTIKYDRIMSCEVVEHVGDEFLEQCFSCCDSALAENGILVLQFSSVPDQRYEEFRRSPSFIREHILPGAYLLSLNRMMTAMTAASRLCVNQVENIGLHYYPTVKHWRKNFAKNKREVLELGFDEKFIRTWECYFDYTAAGFKTGVIGNYQVVLSRPWSVSSFDNLGNGGSSPSANSFKKQV